MRRLVTTHKALGIAVGVIAFYVVGYITFGYEDSKMVMDVLGFSGGLVVSILMLRAFLSAFFRGFRLPEDKYVATVWLSATYFFLSRAYAIWFVSEGRPQWLLESPVGGLLSTWIVLAVLMAIAAPMSAPNVPRPAYTSLLIGATLAGVLAGTVLTLYFTGAPIGV